MQKTQYARSSDFSKTVIVFMATNRVTNVLITSTSASHVSIQLAHGWNKDHERTYIPARQIENFPPTDNNNLGMIKEMPHRDNAELGTYSDVACLFPFDISALLTLFSSSFFFALAPSPEILLVGNEGWMMVALRGASCQD